MVQIMTACVCMECRPRMVSLDRMRPAGNNFVVSVFRMCACFRLVRFGRDVLSRSAVVRL